MSRVAVVLFNLGGPDSPAAIKPFLLNLFRDPAILRVPFFVRPLLAQIIARARVKPASENYAILGGKSPLLELTQAQAAALDGALAAEGLEAKCFIAMRYWHPFAAEAVREVAAWAPDEVVLVPLYPQFSSTTTGSSVADWQTAAAEAGFVRRTTTLCCYPDDGAYLAAAATLIRPLLAQARLEQGGRVRVLFSAHGLPEVIVARGDPYQFQVERTVAGIVEALADPALDFEICFQSRATPQKWLEPSTEQAIERAAEERMAVLVVPVAFVSEHSETLVELDVEYREVAHKMGVPGYYRAPAQNSDAGFITALARLVKGALAQGPGPCRAQGGRICDARFKDCPLRSAA